MIRGLMRSEWIDIESAHFLKSSDKERLGSMLSLELGWLGQTGNLADGLPQTGPSRFPQTEPEAPVQPP